MDTKFFTACEKGVLQRWRMQGGRRVARFALRALPWPPPTCEKGPRRPHAAMTHSDYLTNDAYSNVPTNALSD